MDPCPSVADAVDSWDFNFTLRIGFTDLYFDIFRIRVARVVVADLRLWRNAQTNSLCYE